MTFAVSTVGSTATTIVLQLSGLSDDAPSSPTSLYLQVSPRPDFQFCVCPTYVIPTVAVQTILGFNQRCTYYLRARRRYSDGSVDALWSPVVGTRTADGTALITAPQNIMISPAMIVIPVPILSFNDPQGVTVPGFPPENLARDSPVVWRATNASGFLLAFNAPAPIDTIAVLNSNLPENATMLIRAGQTLGQATGDSPAFKTATLPFRASANLPGRDGYHGLFILPDAYSYPWWSITIIGQPPMNMLQIEHLVAGQRLVSKNHSVDKNETAAPLTTVSRNRSGMVDRVFGRPMRKVDFDISMLTEAQYETMYGRLWQQQNNPVLVVPNARNGGFLHDRILYGDLAAARTINPASPRYSMSLSVSSII